MKQPFLGQQRIVVNQNDMRLYASRIINFSDQYSYNDSPWLFIEVKDSTTVLSFLDHNLFTIQERIAGSFSSQDWCEFMDLSVKVVDSNTLRIDLFTPDTSAGMTDRKSIINYRYNRVLDKPLDLSSHASLEISCLPMKMVNQYTFLDISSLRNALDASSYYVLILEENEEGLFFLVPNAFEQNSIKFLRFGEKGVFIED